MKLIKLYSALPDVEKTLWVYKLKKYHATHKEDFSNIADKTPSEIEKLFHDLVKFNTSNNYNKEYAYISNIPITFSNEVSTLVQEFLANMFYSRREHLMDKCPEVFLYV